MGWMTVLYPDGTENAMRRNEEPTYDELRTYLKGGYVEVVHVLHNNQRAQLIVDEEGGLKGLPLNPKATEIYKQTAMYMADQYKKQGMKISGVPEDAVIVGVAILLQGNAMCT